MRAAAHTETMLHWWTDAGILRADLAVRRRNGAMLWHKDFRLADLPLPWARLENVRASEIYIRPARGRDWPLVFLDDVRPDLARRIASKYRALVVQTSPMGGCHLWLHCSACLHERARLAAQRWLAERTAADRGSTSGEHLGRLAGMKNWKRSGCWVNVLWTSDGRSWDPAPALTADLQAADKPRLAGEVHRSASEAEWGWICGLLEAGIPPQQVVELLVDRCHPRRGSDAPRYARRSVNKAVSRTRRS